MVARGFADPRKEDLSQTRLDPAISSYLDKCKQQDPPSQPQQALPSSTIYWIFTTFSQTPLKRLQVVAHLIVLAFFFLLRVGEYTPSTKERRTIPLRGNDIKLWVNGTILPHTAPLATLLTANAVTICLENQKNGKKNAVLHHTKAGNTTFCPVWAAAHLVHELQGQGHAPLGTFVDERGHTSRVQASDIRSAIRAGAVATQLELCGYDLKRIGSHSLRSGGAMHLKLAGHDNDIIMKLGRWTSNTYLHYIQSQIGELTAGIATDMARLLHFHHVSS
jgi:hypothetical protein